MFEQESTERRAVESFKVRMQQIEEEVQAIDRELAQRNIIALAHRAREAIRLTRSLLDKNVEILFARRSDHFHQDLYDHLAYAEGHVTRALSEEVDFQGMEKRLYLATRLVEDVLGHIAIAVGEIEERLNRLG